MAYLGLLLNWLATHLVLLGFFCFLLVGFYFRAPIFGHAAGSIDPSSVPPIPNTVTSTPAGQQKADASSRGEESGSKTNVPASKSHSASLPVPGGKAGMTAEVDSVFRPTESSSAPFSPQGEKKGSRFRDPEREPVTAHRGGEERTQRRLAAGRNAFLREDFDSAEMHYLRYLAERPEDPQAFAELGNLYRIMGRPEDALDAYYEAAVRFWDLNEWGEVQQLGGILDRAGDSRGAQLLRLPR